MIAAILAAARYAGVAAVDPGHTTLVPMREFARSAGAARIADAAPVDPGHMTLIKMYDFASDSGAVCLDGSPGAFYFRAATDAANANNWLLHFKGAGWCYDENDCLARSKMEFGTSTKWPNVTGGWNGGILSPGDETFGGFNKVVFEYCDGASFTGNRNEPITVHGDPLYFRGARIRDAIVATLVRDYQFGEARNVLLTGCSSGGLAAYVHTDWMESTLADVAPHVTRFKVAPASGFFALHNNVDGLPVYADQIKNIFALSNSTGGVSPRCIAAQHPADEWKCMSAIGAYTHSTAPTFVENSALDMWQTACIFTASPIAGFPNAASSRNGNCSAADGRVWAACSSDPSANCSVAQIKSMNGYLSDYVSTLNATSRFHGTSFPLPVRSDVLRYIAPLTASSLAGLARPLKLCDRRAREWCIPAQLSHALRGAEWPVDTRADQRRGDGRRSSQVVGLGRHGACGEAHVLTMRIQDGSAHRGPWVQSDVREYVLGRSFRSRARARATSSAVDAYILHGTVHYRDAVQLHRHVRL
jgi:STAM-binding protein